MIIIASNGRPDLKDVILGMLDQLRTALGLPTSAPITVLSAAERPVGLSNLRGQEAFGPLPAILLKGGRIDAALRFEVLAANAADADARVFSLHGKLLGARGALRTNGFLKIEAGELSPAELAQNGTDWRRTASYRVLYEYQYRDTDGAAGLITSVPVHSDPEEEGSPDRENWVVAGDAACWADSSTPKLVVRGPATIGSLWVLSFLPGPTPTQEVRVVRTFEGAPGEPTSVSSLAALAAFIDPPHAQVVFDSVDEFLGALLPTPDAVEFAGKEPDDPPNSYAILSHAFTPVIELSRTIDRFEVSTPQGTGWNNNLTVLHLRIERA